jgi:hypothetical protein
MNDLLTDQNHGYEDPVTPIGRQVPVNRPVSIGAGSWLGAGAIILPRYPDRTQRGGRGRLGGPRRHPRPVPGGRGPREDRPRAHAGRMAADRDVRFFVAMVLAGE